MSESNSTPDPPVRYSALFWTVSSISGAFTGFIFLSLGQVTVSEALEQAKARSLAAFCIGTYLVLQILCAAHQRRQLKTPRAAIYFLLLAFFPVWSLPIASLVVDAIIVCTTQSLSEGARFFVPLVSVITGLLALNFTGAWIARRSKSANRIGPHDPHD